MFETIKRLYLEGVITDAGLQKAVEKKPTPWITQTQADEIKASKSQA